jgi:hypothetical protein
MAGAEEGRCHEQWLRIDIGDARCVETFRIDAEEGAEVRVLQFETRDLVLAHL